MRNYRTKDQIHLNKPSLTEASPSDNRGSITQRSKLKNDGLLISQPTTRAGTSLSHRSHKSQISYKPSLAQNFEGGKGWITERTLTLQNPTQGLNLGFPFGNSSTQNKKQRPASSYHPRPLTGSTSYRPRSKRKTEEEEMEQIGHKDLGIPNLEALKASILRDIPRMRDISDTAANSMRNIQEKFKKVDQIYKLDLSRTFRSKFEEEVITAAEAKALGSHTINKVRLVKLMTEERFMLSQDQTGHFRLKAENIKFPLEVKIDYLPRDAEYFFEVYVSSTVLMPTISKNDFRFMDKTFKIEYENNPSYLYFTIAAISALNIKLIVSSKEDKMAQTHSGQIKHKNPIKHLALYRQSLEMIPKKGKIDYEFLTYAPDEMARFKEEVDQIKKERALKYQSLARNGRNIIKNNAETAPTLTQETVLMHIKNRSEEKMFKGEEVRKRKEDIMNEKRIKRFIFMNKVEIKDQARHNYIDHVEKEEAKKHFQRQWIKVLVERSLLHELALRLEAFKLRRLRSMIERLNAIRIQKAYRAYRVKKGRTPFERKLTHAREALNLAVTMMYINAKKKSEKIVKQFLDEISEIMAIEFGANKLLTSVMRIQRNFRRYKFKKYLRKVCVMKIIKDFCQDFKDVKDEKSATKVNTKKKKKSQRTQFYHLLQENKDFQRFVVEYYARGKHLADNNMNSPNSNKKSIKKKGKTAKDKQTNLIDSKNTRKKALLIEDLQSLKNSRSQSCSSSSSSSSKQSKNISLKKASRVFNFTNANEQEADNFRQSTVIPSRENVLGVLETCYKKIITEAVKTKQPWIPTSLTEK